jgi:archaellum biogenesis protein FlaJ (TadC family)
MKLERRRGSLDTADTVLAVVVGVLAVMAALWVVSWVIGTFLFLIKLAVVGLVIAGVVALFQRFKSS